MKKWIATAIALVALTASAARLFVASSSMSGSTATVPGVPLSEPVTLAAWFKATVTNANWIIVNLSTNTTGAAFGRRQIGVAGSSGFSGQVFADATDSGTRMLSPAITPGTWYHVAAVFVSSTERYLYLNGVPVATNTSAPTTGWSGHRMLVGTRHNGSVFGQFADGRIAEVALWAVALSAGQVSSLAAGKDPRTVSATAPLVYWPMLGESSPENALVGPLSLTLTNSPTKADHPPVVRP